MSECIYQKNTVALDKLEQEILASSITIALDSLSYLNNTLSILFKAQLSESEITTLNNIVDSHDGIPPLITDTVEAVIKETIPFPNPSGYRARYFGVNLGKAIAGEWTTLEYKLTSNRALGGVILFAKNHVFGDNVALEVVDKDNVLGFGSNIVLDRFGDNWFVDPDKCEQSPATCNFNAYIKSGLYFRVIYDSKGSVDVDLLMNLKLFVHP